MKQKLFTVNIVVSVWTDAQLMYLSMLIPYSPQYGKGGDKVEIWQLHKANAPPKLSLLGTAVTVSCKLRWNHLKF